MQQEAEAQDESKEARDLFFRVLMGTSLGSSLDKHQQVILFFFSS